MTIFLKICVFATIVLPFLSSFGQSFGLRAGFGQFASQAEKIDGGTGNAACLTLGISPTDNFRIDIGVRYNAITETEITSDPYVVSPITVNRITQKLGYTTAYLAPALNIDLAQIGTGFSAYAYAGGGFAFATIINRLEYAETGSSPIYLLSENHQNWKPLFLIGGGMKVIIYYFGVFGEFSYYDGKELEYEPVNVRGILLLDSGSVAPKGFAAYLGLCFN